MLINTRFKIGLGSALLFIMLFTFGCAAETDTQQKDVSEAVFLGNWGWGLDPEGNDVVLIISNGIENDDQFNVKILEDRNMCFCNECSLLPVAGLELNNFQINPSDASQASLQNINMPLTSQVTLVSAHAMVTGQQIFLSLDLLHTECTDFTYHAAYTFFHL